MKFEINDTETKKNPNSLRKLLFDIIQYKYDGNVSEAARFILKSYVERYGIGTKTERSIRAHIKDIIEDRRYIEYWHLEAFAQMMQVPAGLLLIFSRMRSEGGAADHANARIIRDGVSDAMLRTNFYEPLDVSVLDDWAESLRPLQTQFYFRLE